MRAPAPEPAPDIFGYLNYREYLRSWFGWKKVTNQRFSYRLFARLSGQRSPSLLLHVIEGKRNLTPTLVTSYKKALKLSDEEGVFFEALVTLDQGGTPQARNRAWEKISATQRFRHARRLEGVSFRCVSHWYYTAIHELSRRPDFCADPAWIASMLRPAITAEQAETALSELLELGLLVEGADGIVPADASVTTPHEVAGLAAHNYHDGMIRLAQESLTRFRPLERHLTGLTVAIPAALVPRLKQELAGVAERMLDLCDSNNDTADLVYQINLQAFPLSRAEANEGEE
jgi:uncharacterized protein (TIGR02147 family)